ncbi:hypothetical protein PR048_017378 [Dryococelus australis]|uniref:Uncharacterized protein n=1 Tax=Dryococelus australis TaxID=614101 RepID=A0ABQ9H9D0_9NEOP|nr:hypothetical protein PR048_017378 [Dryococelus australis]
MKIMRSAADIRQDIQSHIYDSQESGMSSPTLLTFLQEVMNKKTKRVEETISLLPLYRRFASKNLVQILANLGFCSSYHEAQT